MESTQLHSLGCKVNTKSQGVDQSEEIKSTTKITDCIEIKEFASDEFILPSVKLRSTSELTPIFKDSINLSSESLCLEDNSHRDHSNTEDSNEEIKQINLQPKRIKTREFYKSRVGYRSFENNLLHCSEQMEICRASKDNLKTQDVFTKLGDLGTGSYGKVYKVFRKQDKTEYALKVVNGDLLRRENKIHEIHVEKHILNNCQHKNIVGFHQSFAMHNDYYLLLEYCSNGSLYEYMKERRNENRRMNEDEIKYFAANIINGLEFLHNKGVIHRDLKPSNLLLSSSNDLKICDFGTSCLIPGTPIYSKHKFCNFVGTIEYISPEVIQNQEQSPMIDIWALGVIMYEMFTGTTPFEAPTEILIYDKIKNHDPMEKLNTSNIESFSNSTNMLM